MKKILLLLLLVVNYSFAQEFQPFVFKPQETDFSALERGFERQEKGMREADEQFSKLIIMLSEYGMQLNNDKNTLDWFNNFKNKIQKEYYSIPFDWSLRLRYAIRMQGEIACNLELMARIRTTNEYKSIINNILERNDLSQNQKKEWILNHPYYFIPILNQKNEIIGGKLGTKEEFDSYNAEVARRARIKQEKEKAQEEARLYAMTHPFDNYDYSQYDRIIDNPQYTCYYSYFYDGVMITRIALSPKETRIELMRHYTDGCQSCSIKKETYIKAPGTKYLPLLRVENIPIYPQEIKFKKTGEILKFALIFPPLPAQTKKFKLTDIYTKGLKFKNIYLQ